MLADHLGVLELGGSTLEIPFQHTRIFDAELIRHGFHDDGGHVGGVSEEGVQVTQGADLHGHAELGVGEAAGVEQGLVGGFEVEEFSEVFRGGVGVVACVAADLFWAEEVCWHALMLLRV